MRPSDQSQRSGTTRDQCRKQLLPRLILTNPGPQGARSFGRLGRYGTINQSSYRSVGALDSSSQTLFREEPTGSRACRSNGKMPEYLPPRKSLDVMKDQFG